MLARYAAIAVSLVTYFLAPNAVNACVEGLAWGMDRSSVERLLAFL
ncbi:hypothetical protein EV05_0031 [Prochlorococcus sp. MIT 0601]|nr:hypothetical protein EV05_0031 [Prochlorococcus sp. MIT 0601]